VIRKNDPKDLEQLALGLDLPEPEEEAGLSRDEVMRMSMAAMQALEAGQETASQARSDNNAWFSDYLRLKELGFSWRVAAYIAWEASPRGSRWPGTVAELATEVLGLKSPRVIYTWRKKNPAIDEIISVMQTEPLYEHRRDVIEALIAVASDPDYKGHADRKLFFEMIGDYVPRSQVDMGKKKVSDDDLSELSDEELLRLTERLKDKEAESSKLKADSGPTSPDVGTAPIPEKGTLNLDGSRLETEDGQEDA
jgi:hypothetical protein